MKHYRMLIALFLVALMSLSVYTLMSEAKEKEAKLDELLALKQEYEDAKLYSRASDVYLQIIELDSNVKYYIEAANMYMNIGDLDNAEVWGNAALGGYPTNPEPYEVMLRLYAMGEEYDEAFKLLKEFDGRKLSSSAVEETRDEIKFAYQTEWVFYEDISECSGGYARVRTENDTFGLLGGRDKESFSDSYKQLGYFCNGMIAVCNTEGEWYFVNEDGENQYNISHSVKGKIESVGCYSDDVFSVCVNGKYCYYDVNFEKTVADGASYDYGGAFLNGIAAVCNDEKWELIDKSGNSVTGKVYQDIITDERGFCNDNNRIFVKENGKYYLIDGEGNRIGDATFDDAKTFFGDSRAATETENNLGLFSEKKSTENTPSEKSYAAVKIGEEWGFVDKDGSIVIEPAYKDAQSFGCGLAAVYDGSEWKYIDTSGTVRIEYETEGFEECRSFDDDGIGYAKCKGDWLRLDLYSKM